MAGWAKNGFGEDWGFHPQMCAVLCVVLRDNGISTGSGFTSRSLHGTYSLRWGHDNCRANQYSNFQRHCKVSEDDVVISRSKRDPSSLVCKRVKAVNGECVKKGWFPHCQVPEGHVWLEGDNRSDSTDSWDYGPVPFGLMRSRVVFRIWPLRRMGLLSNRWFFDRGNMRDE